MSISTKKIKGKDYVYFTFYDPHTGEKDQRCCGREGDQKTTEILEQLQREYLQTRIEKLENEKKELEKDLKQLTITNEGTQAALVALDIIRNAPIYEPKIYFKSSELMEDVSENSVQLIVTSPPYNVGKNYSKYEDKMDLEKYLDYLDKVWSECKRVLCTGGRIAINIADTWRQPYVPLHAHITKRMLNLGFLMRGIIYWNKGASVGVSTAWGSWRLPSNPTIRDVGEYILIFSKDNFKLESPNKIVTMTSKDFTDFTKSVWTFPTSNGAKNGHPAPFPEELPKRLIKFYTYLGDTVLDPFLGSGTSCKVAKAWGRKSIGYEIDKSYKDEIHEKISNTTQLAIPLESFMPNDKGLAVNSASPAKEKSLQ
jgi:DNA modification methylase